MQPLGDTHRLPRLIAGSRSGGLGDLRPGHDRGITPNRSAGAMARTGPRNTSRPYGWITLMLIAVSAITLFHLPPAAQNQIRDWADRLAVKTGFAVDHVAVVGHNHTTMSQIAAALDLDADKSLLGFNGADVRRKLQRLPWVDTVQVVHILPDTVSIQITERTPFAIWQHKGQNYLVDRSGHTLAELEGPVARSPYPLVVGKGAGVNAATFLDTVARFPAVARQLKAATRVADRRWNLILHSGKKILLPETGVRSAFATLEALFADKAIQDANVAMIDLRIPERPTLRLATAISKTLNEIRQSRRAATRLLAGDAT